MRKGFLVAGAVFVTMGGGVVLMTSRRPWAPQADFDIIGVLWILSNLPKLFGMAIGFSLCALGVGALVKAMLGTSSDHRLDMSAEEARLLADPRFFVPPERKQP